MAYLSFSKVKSVVITTISMLVLLFVVPTATEASKELFGDKLLIEGTEHSHVIELQEHLVKRGFLDEVNVNEGIYDAATKEAVIAFQEDTGILADGIAGPQTIGALSTLSKGDKGKKVVVLQQTLHILGYYNGRLDGLFGPLTHRAVVEFQTAQKITVDGLAGPQTYGKLNEIVNSPGRVPIGYSKVMTRVLAIQTAADVAVSSSRNQYKSKESSSQSSASSNSSSNDNQGKVMKVEATAYTAYCKGCSGITYTGLDLRKNPDKKVIAVDPNVIPLGSKVEVEGYGVAIASDIGSAIKGHKIDLFMPSREDALKFGRRTLTITVLE